jgi:uncharacterized integral membrane protein (TIGR00698 family)
MIFARLIKVIPGALLCFFIGFVAAFLGSQYGAPQMLFALLLGMALNFLSKSSMYQQGIEFSSKSILRIGVALLGLRITFGDISSLSYEILGWIAAGILLSLCVGIFLARSFGSNRVFGIISGGSVGICGASAALAISSVLPSNRDNENATIVTVVTVTTLSTIAMILYPIIAIQFGFDDLKSGIFLGGTIHDVAQVVGAGYGMNADTGDVATIIKLFRVALLVPVVMIIAFVVSQPTNSVESKVAIPYFLIAFCCFVLINSFGFVPQEVTQLANIISSTLLVTAIAALGVKTSLQGIARYGLRSVALIAVETVLLAAWVIAGILWII